ncbi:Uncharacterised protein [Campylobacter hyointestinalis subsp. hyointestinalis]|uniref:Uncharacterized protein n=1 Tax=Campylobacter hyointestinalis subsp. hyointestinalis TaxID=91352 RepID=A0A9W5EZN5_CAMHY|nr:hypothetical protein [Campylobacter hyointestinalis]CUU79151.1 Uncharacterised protein [Campylobacter hyointestinalis subsp. hyointestinalis]
MNKVQEIAEKIANGNIKKSELMQDIIEHLDGNENGELEYISKDLNYVRNELSSRDLEEIFSNNEEICMEIAGQKFNPKNIKQSIQDVAELAVFSIANDYIKIRDNIENKEDYALKLLFNDNNDYKNMFDRQEDIQNLVCQALGDVHIPIRNFECYDEHSMIMDGIDDIQDVKKISEMFSDMGYETSIFSKEYKNVIVLTDKEHIESFKKATDYLIEKNYYKSEKKTIDFKSKLEDFSNSKKSKEQNIER